MKEDLVNYLTTSGKLRALKTVTSLWMNHDRVGKPGERRIQ